MIPTSTPHPQLPATPAPQAQERRATWLELFFDLVFVLAITAMAQLLGRDVSWHELGVFLAVFQAVFWVWIGHMLYSSRFARDDLKHRLLTLALMLTAAAMAVAIPKVHQDGGRGFILAYALARGISMGMYLRPHWALPEARGVHRVYVGSTLLAAGCWLLSLALPVPARYSLWVLGIAVDLVAPWLDVGQIRRFPVNTSHLPERLGLFVLIVLGESVFSVLHGLASIHWLPMSIAAAVLAFAMAACLWWGYFSFVELAEYECTLGSGVPYIYAHLPLVIGLTAIAVGLNHLILEVDHAVRSGPTLVLLGAGLVLWLVAFLGIQALVEVQRPGRLLLGAYAWAIAAVVACTALGFVLPPLAALALLVAVFALLTTFEVRYCEIEIARIMAQEGGRRRFFAGLSVLFGRPGRPQEAARMPPAELHERLERGEQPVLLDVRRHPDEQQIPGSLRLEPEPFLAGYTFELPFDRDRLIITYCT